jgi:hypothetical protein
VPTDETLHGVYDDGWASSALIMQYGRAASDRAIRMEFEVPGWLPIRVYELSIQSENGSPHARRKLKPGSAPMIEVPIGRDAGKCRVHIKPFFRSIELSETTDARKLTIMVRRIDIRGRDKIVTMFPRANGA